MCCTGEAGSRRFCFIWAAAARSDIGYCCKPHVELADWSRFLFTLFVLSGMSYLF